MNARTSWSLRAGRQPGGRQPGQPERDDGLPLDDLLGARFDGQGRLAQIGRGTRQRVAERLDPRPPAMSPDELERAVQKLARGLEEMERQSAARRLRAQAASAGPDAATPTAEPRRPASMDRAEQVQSSPAPVRQTTASRAELPAEPRPVGMTARPAPRRAEGEGEWPDVPARIEAAGRPPREFVTAPLDRLEAMLESLTLRLEQREAAQRVEAAEDDRAVPQAWTSMDDAEPEDHWDDPSPMPLHAAVDEGPEPMRAAPVAGRVREERPDHNSAELMRLFTALEQRVASLQAMAETNQIEPVRQELLALLRQMEELGRAGHSVSGAVEDMRTRMGELESTFKATRNLAGNRLAELQDRIADLTRRLSDLDEEPPVVAEMRQSQAEILDRIDRMDDLVQRFVAPEDLWDRLDALRQDLGAMPSQAEVARIEEQLLHLAERLDGLPEHLSDGEALERIEAQLQGVASGLAELRRLRNLGAAELEARFNDLTDRVDEIRQSRTEPDLSAIEERLAGLGTRIDADRRSLSDAILRLDRHLSTLAGAIDRQEETASAKTVAALEQKLDGMAAALAAQDSEGPRRNFEALSRKLDALHDAFGEQAEFLSRPMIEPLERRLDEMQALFEDLKASNDAKLGPVAQQLQDIAGRLNRLAADTGQHLGERLATIEESLLGIQSKTSDGLALHSQLEGIIRKLDAIQGKTLDPARMAEFFDRLGEMVASAPSPDRFAALERKIDAADPRQLAGSMDALREEIRDGASERFDRLERLLQANDPERFADMLERTAARVGHGLEDERISRIEAKIEEIGRALSDGAELFQQSELSELRADVAALRRELRSAAAAEGDASLAPLLKALSERLDREEREPPATSRDLADQMERIAALFDTPQYSRMAFAQIEATLQAIQERLEDGDRPSQLSRLREEPELETDAEAVSEVARALSDELTSLKSAAQSSDRKTRESLEAVQDTLEAVVKRMAFLEREAELDPAGEGKSAPALRLPAAEPFAPLRATEGTPAPEAKSDAQPIGAPMPGRFSSSQLLRRATGGRAGSFTPGPDESEEAGDLPLEPGTDSPLSSALSGAPSADTALMSGTRAKSARPEAALEEVPAIEGGPEWPRLDDKDPAPDTFLAAARRAAQAATVEQAEAENARNADASKSVLSRLLGGINSRRKTILAGALAIAVALTALQFVRERLQAEGAGAGRIAAASTDAGAAGDGTEIAFAAPELDAEPLKPRDEAAPLTPEAAAAAQGGSPMAPAAEEPATTAAMPLPPVLPASIGPEDLRQAALAGDAAAQFEVAVRYQDANGVAQDLVAAAQWYERAAEAGMPVAQYRLGSIYENGIGVPKDLARAQSWYRRAADAGNVKSMHNLAVLHAEGAGGEPNLTAAAGLFRRAAEYGVRDSQFNIAILHARGLGVPLDLVEAYKWFSVAAEMGDTEAGKRRDAVASQMTSADLVKAQAAAEAFEPLPADPAANEVGASSWGPATTAAINLQADQNVTARVQELLAEKGYYAGTADGISGPQTRTAIRGFQKDMGLPETGEIDAVLVKALEQGAT